MRRLMVLSMVTALIMTVGGSASAGRTLVEEKEYSGAQGFSIANEVNAYWTNLLNEVPRSTAPGWAKTVSIEISDQTSQPVAGHIHVDEHGDGKKVKSYDICGKTAAPLDLPSHAVIEVLVVSGTCDTGFALATTGTISFTYGR